MSSDGLLTVRIRGLLLPSGQFAGTTGACEDGQCVGVLRHSSTPVGTSGPIPLSGVGDARIVATLMPPAKCQIPAVLIRPDGAAAVYIATSGFGG